MKKIITLIIVSLLVFSGRSFSQYNTCAGTIAYSAIGTTTGVGATQIGAGVAGTSLVISITYNALSTAKCSGIDESIVYCNNAGAGIAAWFSTTTVGTSYTFTTTDGFARLYKRCPQGTSDATVSWYTIDACGNNVCNGAVPTLVQMSNAPISTCSATFTDPGGCTVNYGTNQTFTQTFCPATINSCINVNFTSFALSLDLLDNLKIYDGNSTAAPLMGTYTGNTSPGFVTPSNTNATGCLTFVFVSSASNVAAGWRANVTCGTCPVICPANACPSGTTCISGNCVPNCNTAGVTPPANDAIGNAESITNCGVSFYTCNYNATPGPCTGDPQGGGFNNDLDCNGATGNSNGGDVTFSVENDIWYKFCPLATGPWTLNIAPSQCNTTSGYQYSIFYGTPTNLTQLVAGGTNGLNLTSAASINFNVTQTALCYYLQIDGYGGTECIFAVNVGPSTPGAGCALAAAGTTICSGTTATLTASGSGGIFKWYDAATGGTLLFTGNPYTTPVLTTTTSYYVSETIGGVESARTIVTVTVNPNATITLTSAAGTNIQTHCINTAITNITYTVAGGGTGAGVTGLPAGVTGSFAGGVFTISGTPTATGTFNYTVTTTGTCAQVTATGTITVTPNATIVLSSAAGTNAQTICLTAAITTITYTVGGGGTGAGVAGLPAGVTGSFAGSTFTISGTPTATGTFNYTVTTTGTCTQVTATGTIIVNPNATITLTSAAATTAQTLCISAVITNITYTVGGSGTGAGVTGLPAGVTGSFAGGVFTISGTPTASGTFNYTITTTGTCMQATATGSITVNPLPAITSIPFTNETSCGANDGTITINATGTGLTYSINGGTSFVGTNFFTGLVAGSYTIIVKNAAGCTVNGGVISISSFGAPATPTANAAPNPLCAGSALTLSVTAPVGGETYNWSGPGGYSDIGSSVSIPSVTTSMTGVYTVTASVGTCVSSGGSVSVTVNPNAAIVLTSAVGTDAQTWCLTDAITTITYSITGGGTGAGVTGLPAGVTGSFSGGVFTISGTPTVTGVFNYMVTTTGSCTQANATGSITINSNAIIILTSVAGSDIQTSCINVAITPITYSVSGGGGGAGVTGLPIGVAGSFSGGIFTISGTPTATGIFNYTVTTTGTCTQTTATGTINVNPDAIIALTSAAGTEAQTVCINIPITTITYSVTGGGTGAGVTGLPAGVNGSFAGGVFTVFGTPTASGTFNYSVTTTGSCAQATATGSIVVNPDASINLTSAAGTDAQTPCLNSAIIPITYSVTGGGVSAGITGLPAGVTGSFASGVFTISGTPTATGTFNYMITTTGTCAQTTAFGSIVINPDAAISLTSTIGTDAQTVCINTAISAITYSVTGGGTGAGVAGLPTGVTGSFSGGVFTISGTPSVSGTFNYTITTTGTCSQVTATGSININALPVIDTANIVITPASCGMSDGSITGITASGATVLSYTWNAAASATTDLINIPVGAYTLVAMDINNCTSSMGPVQLINPGAPAAPAASSPPAYCQGDVIADLTATGTGGTLTWYSDAGLTTQIGTGSPFASGATNTSTFYVTEIISGCQSSPTIITVTINPTPAAPTAPSPPAYCLGDPIFDLTATGTGGTLTWFGDMALTNQLATGSPFVSGATISSIFYVTETASGCQSIPTAVTITIDSLPVITSIPFTNESACGTPDGTITINATGNGLLYSIDGGVTFVASNLFTGLDIANYTVVVKNSAGCITNGGIVSISFIGNPLMPTVIANPNPVCVDSTLTLSVSAPVGGETYTWYGPGAYLATGTSVSLPTITPSMGGTYSVTATNGNCVSPAGTISVTVNPNAVVNLTSAIGTDSQTACVNTLINTITYSITGGGTGAGVTGLPSGITGSFAGGIFTISGTPSVTGTFNYTITTTGTCVQAIVTGSISVNPNAAIALTSAAGTNGQVLCVNTSITSITYSITGGGTGAGVSGLPAGVTGTFSGGVFTISGTPTISGTFNYTVTTTGTCVQATGTGSITVNPNASIALTSAVGTNTQTICINAAITTITYSITGGGTGAGVAGLPAGITGSFAGGVFTISGTPTAGGSFNYTITTTGACAPSSAIGSIMVNLVPPAPGASSNSPVCEGSALNLTSNTVTGATYSWTGPNGFTSPAEDPIVSASATIAMSGTYSVTVTVAGCTSPAGTTSVIVNPLPVVSAGTDAMIISGSSITLTASGGGSYLWSTGEVTNPITVSPTVTTDYCVTVLDANSCSDSACVRIIVEIPCGTLFVPLAFSPNGDNENDVLSVYGDCITYLEFVIFDRWGEKIFETSDSAISWDGTYKGKKLDPAVFVYYLKATVKGESVSKHGNITLTK